MSLYVDIKKSYGDFKLNIQFETEKEILALLGASGCGKSVTLKCIAGIEKPDIGQIILDGKVLFDSVKKINLPPQKRKTGYLFQNYALFPNMTIEENIAVGIQQPKSEKGKIIAEKIKAFYLDGLEKRYPCQISGGQQQRAALARIVASEPNILMLDEPFSALDSYLRWQLEQEMSSVLQNFKGTTLFVSHNRDEVYRLCDRIAVISNGSLETVSEKWSLFENPKTVSASLLTGCKNISHAKKISNNIVEATDWGINFDTEQNVTDNISYVGIRAHYFEYGEAMNSKNLFEIEIVKEIEDTFSIILMIRAKNQTGDNKSLIRWEVNKDKWKTLKIKPKYLSIRPEKILLLEK